MGADTPRITAGDFLIPPEFAGRTLAPHDAGRIGGARFELQRAAGATRLGTCYQQVPIRLLPPFPLAGHQPVLLYLLTLSPGLLDGDGHLFQIRAMRGTQALVAGQSATRIHPCLARFATQQWRVHVEAGAVLVVLPGPAIPFERSRYYQRVEIDLEAGAGLVWGDLWFAGRYARRAASEQFQFDCLVQELLIRREHRLVFHDRFTWQGPWDLPTATWHFGLAAPTSHAGRPEPYPACGSLFATGPLPEPFDDDQLASQRASFVTAHGDCCCRWYGNSEAVLASLVATALRCAMWLSRIHASEPWQFSPTTLPPTHWFSSMT